MATGQGGETAGIAAYVDHVDWKQSAIYGGGAWLAGLIASYAIVTVAGIGDAERAPAGTLDLAVTAYYHGMGGLLRAPPGLDNPFIDFRGPSAMTFVYGLLESRFYGAAIWLHYLVPAIALIVVGYVVAGTYEAGGDGYEARLDAWIGGVSAGAVFGGLTLLAVLLFQPDEFELVLSRLLLAVVGAPVVFAGIGAARQVGFGVASIRGFAGGLGALLLGFVLWYVLGSSFVAGLPSGQGAPSGADRYLPMLGEFLAQHGVFVETGLLESLLPSNLDALLGSPTPGLFVALGPLAVGAAIAYRSEETDPRRAAGRGARIALGYLVAVFLLGTAVLGHRMTTYYDSVYGTGTEEEVRRMLFAEANHLFGGLLPDVTLAAGLLWPAVLGAAGGAIGAKVVESQLGDESDAGAGESTSDEATAAGAGTAE